MKRRRRNSTNGIILIIIGRNMYLTCVVYPIYEGKPKYMKKIENTILKKDDDGKLMCYSVILPTID